MKKTLTSKPCFKSGSSLLDLQRQMATAIMRPLTSEDRMQEQWIDGHKMSKTTDQFIKPNDRLTSFERLEIYNRQYWFRLLDSFYQDFPGLRAVLGNSKYEALAQRYLICYPSKSFTLRNLGSQIEAFLRKEPEWTSPHEKLALDVVRFEWAQVLAFDEAAKPVLVPSALSKRNPLTIRLKLQPYLSLLDLDYPIDDFLIALKKSTLRSEASNAMEGDRKKSRARKISLPKPEKVFIAIHRVNHTLYYKRLTKEGFNILASLRDGVTLGDACANSLGRNQKKNGAARIQQWFKAWMSLGWFCKK